MFQQCFYPIDPLKTILVVASGKRVKEKCFKRYIHNLLIYIFEIEHTTNSFKRIKNMYIGNHLSAKYDYVRL